MPRTTLYRPWRKDGADMENNVSRESGRSARHGGTPKETEAVFAERNLTEKLKRLLKDAQIVTTPLPLTPMIRLYLLSPGYPQQALTDEERGLLMEEPPFWAFCWSSGQVLAKWILDFRENISGKRVKIVKSIRVI